MRQGTDHIKFKESGLWKKMKWYVLFTLTTSNFLQVIFHNLFGLLLNTLFPGPILAKKWHCRWFGQEKNIFVTKKRLIISYFDKYRNY